VNARSDSDLGTPKIESHHLGALDKLGSCNQLTDSSTDSKPIGVSQNNVKTYLECSKTESILSATFVSSRTQAAEVLGAELTPNRVAAASNYHHAQTRS